MPMITNVSPLNVLDQVLPLFDTKSDIDLYLMCPNQTFAQLTSMVFDSLDPIIKRYQPNWILAKGDPITVMVTVLPSYYHRIRFGHVEARDVRLVGIVLKNYPISELATEKC